VARWLTALAAVLLAALSPAAHALAHVVAARRVGAATPLPLRIGVFGDAAHTWPRAPDARSEALVALAGPCASLLLAGAGGMVWRLQLHPASDSVALFVAAYNAGLAALSLAPAYPFDGGRLMCLALRGVARRPERLSRGLGFGLAGATIAWGAYVVALGSRFSDTIGLCLAVVAGLILLSLRSSPPGPASPARASSESRKSSTRSTAARGAAAAVLGALLLLPAAAIVPTPHGLYAPGGAVAVAPMIEIPTMASEPSGGDFLLTTVVGQTPILAGQFLLAHLDPTLALVPPERVVPPEVSPQDLMAENARMLTESQTVASVVALRLAGYDASFTGTGARVTGIGPESQVQDLIQPGDRIVALDDMAVRTTSDLVVALGSLDSWSSARVTLVRGEETLQHTVPLLPPAEPDGPPRIGITVETAGSAADLPFPVAIRPRSILGGPSAGLMLTLAIYDRVTPGDLTSGRRIAGTGTIDPDGRVGPIGSVAQKVAAAERAGASHFLVPQENAADARRASRRITVVEVATVEDAVAWLRRTRPGDSQ
jgi:PDZ domain-containing protein